MEEDPIDQDQIEIKYKLMVRASQTLLREDEQVLEFMMETSMTEEEENQEHDEMNRFQEMTERIRMRKEKLVPSEASNPGSVVDETKRRNFKLPMVQLKQFKGELEEWLGFWSQFDKIHKDETLHASDKFYYLVQSLEPGTEPYDIAQGYPQSAENYQKLVEALTKRYGNEDKQLQVHLRKLLLLVTQNVHSNEKIPVESLFHKLVAPLGALKSLNLKRTVPDSWLYPLVESSLPENILYNWERSAMALHYGSLDNPPRTRLELLMAFLEHEIDIRQKIQISKSFMQNTVKSVKMISERKKPVPTLSSCHFGEETKCAFCRRSNHTTVDCYRAQSMSYDSKIHLLREKKLCFKCCDYHKPFSPCPNKNLKCTHCQGKHISVMCQRGPRRVSNGSIFEPPQKRIKMGTEYEQTTSNVPQR